MATLLGTSMREAPPHDVAGAPGRGYFRSLFGFLTNVKEYLETAVTDHLGVVLTGNGDLLTRVAGAVTRLAVGTTGQVLTVASGLPSWATPAAFSVATDAFWDAVGDLAVGSGSNTASRLAVGTNTHALIADSTQALGVKWALVSALAGLTTMPNNGAINMAGNLGSFTNTLLDGLYMDGTNTVLFDAGSATGVYVGNNLITPTAPVNCTAGITTNEADIKHGERTISLHTAISGTNGAHTWTEGTQYWVSGSTTEDIVFPVPLAVGDRIKSVTLYGRNGTTSTHTWDGRLYKLTSAGVLSTVASGTSATGASTNNTVVLSGLTETIVAGNWYSVGWEANVATGQSRCYGVEVTFDRV